MKKTLTKALSIFLSALMLFSASAVFGFAADPTSVPTVAISKTSETPTEVVITVSLAENGLACLDLKITAADGLTLKTIAKSADWASEDTLFTSNISNGMVSFVCTAGIAAPKGIAVYTYTKSNADGVTGDDFKLEISACSLADDENAEDIASLVAVKNEIPAAHTHVAGSDWKVTVPVSCGTDGTKVRYCTECGEIAETETITATGDHQNTQINHLDATCTADGYDKVYCNDCQQYISETTLPATGHVDTHEERTEPDCTTDGVIKTVCACGEVIKEEPIPATGHVDTHEERTEPDCTTDGVIKTVCACGEVIKEEPIPATGHVDTHTDRKIPTCTEDGYIKEVCACGETISTQVLNKLGHNYINEVKDATCTEDGYSRSICTSCQDIEFSITTTKTGHRWLDWETVKAPTYAATGIERRVCDHCGVDEERDMPRLEAKATELILSMPEITMNFKQTARLFVTILPDEANYSTEIIWESSDESVVTVDEDGQVYAAGLGSATITAKTADGTVEDTCEVTVTYSVLQWIIIYILFGWIWYI